MRDADDDRKLRNMRRTGGPPKKSFPRGNSSFPRSGKNHGCYGSCFHPYRISTEFSKGGGFNQQARGGRYVDFSSPLSKNSASDKYCLGSRVKRFSGFWRTLTQDRWVLEVVSLGVRIPFIERPTVAFCFDNMHMSEKMIIICDEEIKALIEK